METFVQKGPVRDFWRHVSSISTCSRSSQVEIIRFNKIVLDFQLENKLNWKSLLKGVNKEQYPQNLARGSLLKEGLGSS